MGYRKNLSELKDKTVTLLNFIFGALLLLPLLGYIIIAIPAIIYRWFVSKLLIKSWLRPVGISKIVSTGFSTSYAAEYISSISTDPPRPSRNAVVQQSFVKGILPYEEFREMVKQRWLDAVEHTGKTASLKYPELTHYIISWMGHLFWRKDPNFQLENHLVTKTLLPSEDLEEYSKTLMEELLNKPFPREQSPWEIHVIYSCKCCQSEAQKDSSNNSDQSPKDLICHVCGKEQVTIISTRVHHTLGDGISFMTALACLFGDKRAEELETSFEKLTKRQKNCEDNVKPSPFQHYFLLPLKALVSFCHDFGCVASFVLWRANSKTKMHIPDQKKQWQQFYDHSQDFPLQRMKLIKNHFGVSFSALVMHCVCVAIMSHLGRSKNEKDIKNFLSAFVIPLPMNRVNGWINNITGTAYKLPLKANMDSVERLLACDKVMKNVNRSTITQIVFPLLVKIQSLHVTPMVRFGFYNRTFGTALSNFYAPGKMYVNGKHEVLRSFTASGGNEGVNGTIFGCLGYNDRFHFFVTADKAVLKRTELARMVDSMVQEVEFLYEQVRMLTGGNIDKTGELSLESMDNKSKFCQLL